MAEYDPDLPAGPPVDGEDGEFYEHPSAALFTQAHRVVTGLRRVLVDGTEERVPPLPRHARVLTVHCIGADCGPGRGGAKLAEIWRVPGYGLLYLAWVARPHTGQSFPDWHRNACVMVHPGLEADRGSPPATWSTASSVPPT